MLINKDGYALLRKGLRKRVKQIEVFIKYTQCAGLKIVYLVFVLLGVRLFTQKTNYFNITVLFLHIYSSLVLVKF